MLKWRAILAFPKFIEGSGIEPGVIDTKEDVSEKLGGFTRQWTLWKIILCLYTLQVNLDFAAQVKLSNNGAALIFRPAFWFYIWHTLLYGHISSLKEFVGVHQLIERLTIVVVSIYWWLRILLFLIRYYHIQFYVLNCLMTVLCKCLCRLF